MDKSVQLKIIKLLNPNFQLIHDSLFHIIQIDYYPENISKYSLYFFFPIFIESDESPGMYLRDDFLGGPTELRAPTAERAALFLDAALAGRTGGAYESALIFTLHVYQYSLAGKGGGKVSTYCDNDNLYLLFQCFLFVIVAGGRSRLHLIDLGGCANRSGGLPLSAIGNVVLSILSGQRHPPNRDHPLTPLLKDCLAPLTCHVAILAHVSHSQVCFIFASLNFLLNSLKY